MENDEFNRWCAKCVMKWTVDETAKPIKKDAVVVCLSGSVAFEFYPATDLNAMREVELKVMSLDDTHMRSLYGKTLATMIGLDVGTHGRYAALATASVSQRKLTIEAIKDEIEKAVKKK